MTDGSGDDEEITEEEFGALLDNIEAQKAVDTDQKNQKWIRRPAPMNNTLSSSLKLSVPTSTLVLNEST